LLPYKNTKLRRRRRGKEALGGNIYGTGGLQILRQDSYRGWCPSTVTKTTKIFKVKILKKYQIFFKKKLIF